MADRVRWGSNDWIIWHAVDTEGEKTARGRYTSLCGREVEPDLHKVPRGEWCDVCRQKQIRLTTEDPKPLGWMETGKPGA